MTDASGQERAEFAPRITEGRKLSIGARLGLISKDPQIRQGATAAVRTLINTGISAGDLVPIIGEFGSLGADGLKIISRFTGLPGDLTPEVSIKKALLTEGAEIVTLGHAPTHIVETLFQLRHDAPRMREAVRQAVSLWRGEQTDYAQNKEEIDRAISTFK